MTHRRLGVLLLSVAAAAPVIVGAQVRQPGATLSVEQLQAQAFHVSAGKRLKPKAWPNGARVAVGLTFDVDNVSPALNGGNVLADVLSRGEYGALDGVPITIKENCDLAGLTTTAGFRVITPPLTSALTLPWFTRVPAPWMLPWASRSSARTVPRVMPSPPDQAVMR